jgi:predicted Zn finger-like uncharacterized protein
MPITATCPECDTRVKVPDASAGKKVRCPSCKAIFTAPAAEEEAVSRRPRAEARAARSRDEDEDDRRPSRRRDEDEDERPRSRRSRDDDYDDRPSRRVTTRTEEGNGAALGLGIAALCCGIVGVLLDIIPCIGWFIGLPLGGLGLILGIVGLILAWTKEWRGVGFPIAGSAVSVVAVALGLVWAIWLGSGIWRFNKAVQQAQKDAEKRAKEDYDRSRQTLRGQGYMDADRSETSVIDGIEVRVTSAQVGIPNLRLAGRQHNVGNRLIINLAIKNTSQRNRLYQGWGNTASLMLDSFRSVPRARIENGVEVVGQQKNVTLVPGQTVNDVLVFEVPAWSYDANIFNNNTPPKKVLRLDLSGAAFGVGNSARFQIPEDWVTGK